ncbi:MAG: hypothetical protein L3J36_03255 [Rhodobacteraceae bacterium]|nr:hypothetical protein [Paracoccaceae bacterium]
MTTETLTVIFDGVTDVPGLTGQSVREWNSQRMSSYDVYYSGPKDDFVGNAVLVGSDWNIKYLRMAGDSSTFNLTDLDAGTGRRIDYLELGWNSNIDLVTTRARHIYGLSGDKHEVTLSENQEGSTYSISLFAKVNLVTTGNKWVNAIQTGYSLDVPAIGGDTIVVGTGGSGSVSTGKLGDTVTTGTGWVGAINTSDGADKVIVGTGLVGSIRTGKGNDRVDVRDGWAELISTGDGQDTVKTGADGAMFVRTSDGDDKVVTGSGKVETISTGKGNDIVELGAGGAGTINLGTGDDIVELTEFSNASFGVFIRGGEGNDTISFSDFTYGVTFSLSLSSQFQKVTNPDQPLLPGAGHVAVVSVENLTGTGSADSLTGDGGGNKLVGLGGEDKLFGLDGNDILKGGSGRDILKGGAGNDSQKGGAGNDKLFGGAGKDKLFGGAGDDTLTGGGGADVFVFGKNSDKDKVTDFDDGTDILRIADHSGSFGSLTITDQGGDLKIVHDGGTILLVGEAGTTLTSADFDFV